MLPIFKSFLLFVNILIAVDSTSTLQSNCLKKDIPQKFGILTTTYIRNGNTQMFLKYLERYAQIDCDLYDNIYIVWNNPQSPEEMGVLNNKHLWKKKVYFMQTIENSLDFKYILPSWAQQKVFFNMDDDFGITCETLKQGFEQWKNKSSGQISPLASLYGRSYIFNPQKQSFTYIDQIKLNKKWNYYHFGLTGIAFISRHFLDLYYSDIYEIKQMRKQVVAKNNCEDLLLNFLISYLYPELVPQYLRLNFQSYGMVGVSATKTHGQYRAQCITKFSQILGYNPVRYTVANGTQYDIKRTNLHQNCMTNLKQQFYEHNYLSQRAYYLYIKKITGNIDQKFLKEQNENLTKAKTNIVKFIEENTHLKSQVKEVKKQEFIPLSEHDRKLLQDKEMYIHFGQAERLKGIKLGDSIKLVQQSENKVEENQHLVEETKKSVVSQIQIEKQPLKSQEQRISAPQQKPKEEKPNSTSQQSITSSTKSKIIQKSKVQVIKQQIQVENETEQLKMLIYLLIVAVIILVIALTRKIYKKNCNKYHTVPVNGENNSEITFQNIKMNRIKI